MTVDEVLEKLKYNVAGLKSLLDDPQRGLFTWNMAVNQRWKALADLYYPPDNGLTISLDEATQLQAMLYLIQTTHELPRSRETKNKALCKRLFDYIEANTK